MSHDFGRGFGSNGVRLKRPHQDPEKVERTIYIESLPDTVNEEVSHALKSYFSLVVISGI